MKVNKFISHSTIVLALLPGLLAGCDGGSEMPAQNMFPWQISVTADGKSRVFGITFNQSKLQQAASMLGSDYKIALFGDKDESLSLEAYFSDVHLGGLSGKIFLRLQASEDELRGMRARVLKAKPLGRGVVRYTLAEDDLFQAEKRIVVGMSYVPAVNLDEQTVLARFGEPAERIRLGPSKQHFLYPELGLDLLLDSDGKELLQYVAPAGFARLREPLMRMQQQGRVN